MSNAGNYIPRGTRYGVTGKAGQIVWGDLDRNCPVEFIKIEAQYIRLKILTAVAGPEGALETGTEILTSPRNLQTVLPDDDIALDDTQLIVKPSKKESVDQLNKIIENLRESIWDFEHEANYWTKHSLVESVKRMRINLERAKSERLKVLEQIRKEEQE